MIRAYDDNGNVVDLVEWEKQIRADAIKEILDIADHSVDLRDLCGELRLMQKEK